MNGLPGIEKEVHDTVWNLEHLDKRGVASELLRSIIMLGCLYLAVGCLYNSQMRGLRGMEMIPHIGFWSEYPTLVADGVTYIQILAGGLTGKDVRGSSGDLTGGIPRGGAGAARGGV